MNGDFDYGICTIAESYSPWVASSIGPDDEWPGNGVWYSTGGEDGGLGCASGKVGDMCMTLKFGYCEEVDDCAPEGLDQAPSIMQTVTNLTPSGSYKLSLWWKAISVSPDTSPGCSIVFIGDANVDDSVIAIVTTFEGATDAWAAASVLYTMPEDVTSDAACTLYLQCGDETDTENISGEVMIDQVALVPV